MSQRPTSLRRALPVLLPLALASPGHAAILFFDDFDGSGQGYNPNSTTAVLGDNDWVDFSNRIANTAIGTPAEGYTTAAFGTESVLAGSANSGDPQIRSDFAVGLNKSDVDGFQLRLRVDIDQNGIYDDSLTAANFSLFWGVNPYVAPGAQNGNTQVNYALGAPTITTQSDGWHLASWSFAPGSLTDGTGSDLNSLRIDPVNLLSGSSFEIDSITVTGVPEPGPATLLGLAGMALIVLRRRA